MKVVVLVDGEHYPSVTRWAIDELRARGLEPLAARSRLERLHLDGTQVTDKGVARLQRALPQVQIYRARP